MKFFTELKDFPDLDASIRVKAKNGVLTVSFIPVPGTSSGLGSKQLTGTAEEIDEGLIAAIQVPKSERSGLQVNDLPDDDEAPKKAAQTSKEKKPVAGKKTAKEKTAKAEPKAKAPTTPQPVSMFDEPAVDPAPEEQGGERSRLLRNR